MPGRSGHYDNFSIMESDDDGDETYKMTPRQRNKPKIMGGSRRSPAKTRTKSVPPNRTSGAPYRSSINEGGPAPRRPSPHLEDPKQAEVRQQWLKALRSGNSSMSTNSKSMGIVPKNTKDRAWKSMSKYMQDRLHNNSHLSPSGPYESLNSPTTGRSGQTPGGGGLANKPSEEMYDEILELKKSVVSLNNDNSVLRGRIRRMDEDGRRKDKHIEQLLDPGKNDDVRRTITERKTDTAAVVNSLKQKVVKLEIALKNKESELNTVQTDVKMTKIDEMKIAMETFYQEILRMRSIMSSGRKEAHPSQFLGDDRAKTESADKVKALNSTILRLTDVNQGLENENKTLKEDLSRTMMTENSELPEGEYDDMGKNDLLTTISVLDKRLKTYETIAHADTISETQVEGKVKLTGDLAERLHQLDARETELLEEQQRLKSVVDKLKEDRNHFRAQLGEQDKLSKVSSRSDESSSIADRGGGRERHRTPSDRDRVKPAPVSSTSSEHRYERDRGGRQREGPRPKEQQAARTIQKGWRRHKDDVRRKDDSNMDQAALMIQSSVRGHFNREQRLSDLEKSPPGPRQSPSRSSRPVDNTDTESVNSYQYKYVSPFNREAAGSPSRSNSTLRTEQEPISSDDSDDVVMPSKGKGNRSGYQSKSMQDMLYGNSLASSSQRPPVVEESDDDSDDVITPSTRSKQRYQRQQMEVW